MYRIETLNYKIYLLYLSLFTVSDMDPTRWYLQMCDCRCRRFARTHISGNIYNIYYNLYDNVNFLLLVL